MHFSGVTIYIHIDLHYAKMAYVELVFLCGVAALSRNPIVHKKCCTKSRLVYHLYLTCDAMHKLYVLYVCYASMLLVLCAYVLVCYTLLQ
jgi:hypothetical protein